MAANAVVRASVHIGPAAELDGFGLAVDIKVEGVDEELLKAGHAVRLIILLTSINISQPNYQLVLSVQSCFNQRSCRECIDSLTLLHLVYRKEKIKSTFKQWNCFFRDLVHA